LVEQELQQPFQRMSVEQGPILAGDQVKRLERALDEGLQRGAAQRARLR
jgi:hypothetical protein